MANNIMASLSRQAAEVAQSNGDDARAQMHSWNADRYMRQAEHKGGTKTRDSELSFQHQPKSAPSLMPPTPPKGPKATEPQQKFIRSLMSQCGMSDDAIDVANLPKASVNETLKRLQLAVSAYRIAAARPAINVVDAVRPDSMKDKTAGKVHAARYYIESENLTVKVSYGAAGTRWDGWVFLRNTETDTNLRATDRDRVLAIIASDPGKYAIAYGEKYHRCSNCHKKITLDTSIAVGMGSTCRTYFGI